jgi:hypothetical protein
MNLSPASDISISGATVSWCAAEEPHARQFLTRAAAARFAAGLGSLRIMTTTTGAVRYLTYGRRGEILWLSVPS